jgi:hypothetical protein
VILSAICFLRLNEHNYLWSITTCLTVFLQIFNRSCSEQCYSTCLHPPFFTHCAMPIRCSQHNYSICSKRYSTWDYIFLYNVLSAYDWCSFYSDTSVYAAIDSLNVATTNRFSYSFCVYHKAQISSTVLCKMKTFY